MHVFKRALLLLLVIGMLLSGCAHIGEVQTSLWDEDTLAKCMEVGIPLL